MLLRAGGDIPYMKREAQPEVERSTIEADFGLVLAEAQNGAGSACTRIYEWLAPEVAGYLRARGASEPDDMASEVFLRVFSGCRSFSGNEACFRAWVYTIAHSRLSTPGVSGAERPRSSSWTTSASTTNAPPRPAPRIRRWINSNMRRSSGSSRT